MTTTIHDRLRAITDKMERLAAHESPTRAQEAQVEQLKTEFRTLALEQVRMAANGQEGYGLERGTPEPEAQREARFSGDPWDPYRPLGAETRSSLRSRAVSAVERLESMPDAARQAATLTLERDQDPDSRMARWTLASSDPAYTRAFAAWFRDPTSGQYEWTPQERTAYRTVQDLSRNMNLGTGGAGGFLVPFQLDPQIIIASAGSIDPMRSVARVASTTANEQRFITTQGVIASWDAEAAEVSDDSPTLTQPPVTVYKAAAFVGTSYELDEDASLYGQVGALFADAKAQLEANAFTLGTGVGQPRGVVTAVAANAGSVLPTGTNVLSAADIFANQNALPARWRHNAKFMVNLGILNGLRVLIKAPGMVESLVDDAGPRPRMAGWEIIENSNMDGTLTASAADFALLSGDFFQYVIVDRIGTTIIPIPVLFGAARRPTGERGWYLHWRTGGDVLVPDAFRLTNYSG